MNDKPDYTNEAWWESALFDKTEEEIVQLYKIVQESFFCEEEYLEDEFFYPNKVPPRILRRLKQFDYQEIYSFYSPNFAGDGLNFLIDKHHKQTVLVGGSSLVGYYYFVAYLPDRRIGTVWPYIEEYLFNGEFTGATGVFNEQGKLKILQSKPWDLSFWATEEFSFWGGRQQENRFIKAIRELYRLAPEDWYIKEFYPTADDWLQHAIPGYQPPEKRKRKKRRKKTKK